MPLNIPMIQWFYCHKHRIWSIRGCTHSTCPTIATRAETRPTEPPS